MRHFSIAALLAGLLLPIAAEAADIQVLVPIVLTGGMTQLSEAFTKDTGNHVVFTSGTVGTIKAAMAKGLATGVPADLIALPAAEMAMLARTGVVRAGSLTPVGRAALGLAVRTGAVHPDISTPEKFRAVLLAAASVAYNDPAFGSSAGMIADRLLKQPEFAGVKARPVATRPSGYVARGEAEIALNWIPDLLPTRGIDIIGPIPAQYQAHHDFVIGVLNKGESQDAAMAFVRFMTTPGAAAIWKARGLTVSPATVRPQ